MTPASGAPGAYFDWLAVCAPHAARQLRPRAGAADLRVLQTRVGLALPAEVTSLFAMHDGQEYTVKLGVVYGLEFLSTSEVADAWEQWGRAESASASATAVEGHIEDLFGDGGLAFNRFHALASGRTVELTTVDEDGSPAAARRPRTTRHPRRWPWSTTPWSLRSGPGWYGSAALHPTRPIPGEAQR